MNAAVQSIITKKSLFVLTAVAMMTWLWRPIQHENDIFWHLASGRFMMEHGLILRTDVFSSTVFGRPWINHEWLFQVTAYAAYVMAGFRGIAFIKTALVLGAMGFVYRRMERTQIPILGRWALLLNVFWASHYGWNERADLVSVVALSALMTSLATAAEDGRWAKHLRAWPILFAVWANMHGGYVLGLVIVAVALAGDVIEHRAWNASFGNWALLCFVATLLNPWGYHLHVSTIQGLKVLRSGFISEWMKTPWHPLELFWASLLFYWLLFIAVMWKKRAIPWSLFMTHAILSWSAIGHVRNIPYFMVGAFPMTAVWLTSWLRKKNPAWISTFNGGWGICAASLLTGLFCLRTVSAMRAGIDPRWQPVEACDFISRSNMPGRFYNDYGFGGYWMWHFGTTRPVFIDGRLHMLDGFIDLYRKIHTVQSGLPEEWDAFLRSYDVDAAMVAYPRETVMDAPFKVYFPRSRWALVYWDDIAILFLRRTPANAPWIRQYEFPAIDPEAKPAYLVARLKESSKTAKQIRADIRQNERLHPSSRRVHQLLLLLSQEVSLR